MESCGPGPDRRGSHGRSGGQDPSLYPQYAEQFGPPCSSRALAIVHLAMLEALNLVEKTYSSYKAAIGTMSIGDAVVQSLQISASSLTKITVDETSSRIRGICCSSQAVPLPSGVSHPKVANAFRRLHLGRRYRTKCKCTHHIGPEDWNGGGGRGTERTLNRYKPVSGRCIIGGEIRIADERSRYSSDPHYVWQVDPIHPTIMTALGSSWGKVTPWVLTKPQQFRPAKLNTATSAFSMASSWCGSRRRPGCITGSGAGCIGGTDQH